MADKARDLQFRVLSDLSRLDLDKAAREFDQLGDDGSRALTKLDDGLDKSGRKVDGLSDDARDAARKIKGSFDDIAHASRSNLHQKLDDDTSHAKKSLHEVGDEARDTGREMAASFSGSSDDIMSAIQELGANAGVAFGPLGAGLSIALGAGLGTFFADWQKKRQQLTEDVATFTAALVEGQGKLSQEFLNQRIAEIDPGKLKDLAAAAKEAGLPVAQVIRAYAGDPGAIDATNRTLEEARKRLEATGVSGSEADVGLSEYGAAVAKVRDELHLTSDALGESKTAYELMKDAMADPAVPRVDGSKAISDADNTAARVAKALSRKVNIPVGVDGAQVDRAARIAWGNADRFFQNHPITIRTTGTGKRPIRDVP